jgi:hypothetical protein
MTGDEVVAIMVLARVAVQAPHALRLAAQLFEVEPCETCDLIKKHCRCHEQGKGRE